MARQRRIRGSRGPIVLLLITVALCAGAVWAGKYVQDNFMGVVRSEIGMKDDAPQLPPNPAKQAPQM